LFRIDNLILTDMENETYTKEFNHEAGLKVIYEMIELAKSKIGNNYFYYLFWGYLVVVACITEYILITAVKYSQHYLVWLILMPVGTLITLLFNFRQRRKAEKRTFVGTTMIYLWSGWFFSFVILLLFANLKQEYTLIIPLSLAMYGLAIFVSGGIVNFRPLIIGAVLAWMASVASFFVSYPAQLVIMAGVVIVAYIIPGHILRTKSKA